MEEATTLAGTELDELCINTVRTLSMDAVQKADSGHPGTPMALAPLAYVLWTRHLRYDPTHPNWPGRDRFILSAGHASMLLYSVLYLTGYDLPLEQIEQFRQWGSSTPGHPEVGHTPGVEVTTGPLGQGMGNAVGMAIAEAHLAAEFNREGEPALIDHRTYFIASDGDLMEGVSHEAASLAGHLGLGKLIGFYDDNHITIEGSTDLAYSDDAAGRFTAYGWHVQRVEDANDLAALDKAISRAQSVTDRPSLIIVRSHIAFGSPNKHDTAESHGAPLGEHEVQLTKENLAWPRPDEQFYVPDEALRVWREAGARGEELRKAYEARLAEYGAKHPAEARELGRRLRRELPADWRSAMPTFEASAKGLATRAASSKVLNAFAARIPELMGGAADLAPSTKTLLDDSGAFERANYRGRNMHFGIREHGMGAVMNGMALHGGIIPYGGTFLIFSDYMRPPMRLAALMKQHVIYVFTHDSIGLGEDGPTHQPIEQLAALRAIPGFTLFRPADANETAEAWAAAIEMTDAPVALVLTRQNVPTLDRSKLAPASGLAKGGYILADAEGGKPDLVLIASGSEVHIMLEAREQLAGRGIRTRVVSMPSIERFESQPREYRDQVLPPDVRKRVAMEAAATMPWYRIVGDEGAVIGLDHFGASAPYQRLYQEFGLTPENAVKKALELLGR
ncbi:MAG TPA: transketolase [Gemmatimonadaceae bacterium]|nr:transketolase [Gemmatimonadaceae bacterium]